MTVDFTVWNGLPAPGEFLADDRANPARRVAVVLMLDELALGAQAPLDVLELGPGPGWDYGDHFRPLVQAGVLRYRAIEGSEAFVRSMRERWPEVDVRQGTFEDLEPGSADVVYCKAVIEHQPGFRAPLQRLVEAARRLLILTWYRPPIEAGEVRCFGKGCWYNTYNRGDVMGFLRGLGCRELEIVPVRWTPDNEVWSVRR